MRRMISIHALREEGDTSAVAVNPALQISIHALREEGDCEANNLSYVFIKFLSTPSARRATAALS